MAETKLESTKIVYERICASHDQIADFRAKLLEKELVPFGVWMNNWQKKILKATVEELERKEKETRQ